ncbi:MAG: DUF3089 domain-containing protein [Endomicrobium sp.]|jgi:hypothetical protein|nr:DUF3089 domain-containing protein [Endomicrobium sp.]
MFVKSKMVFGVICFLFLLSFNLNAANNKTATGLSSLVYPSSGSFYIPVGGDKIISTDYSDINNWLILPKKEELKQKVDIFYIYPTSWKAVGNIYPVADINNKEMREGANYCLKYHASAFETAGNIFAPYYRQLDAFCVIKVGFKIAHKYFQGIPKTDIIAAFDYYIKNLNEGRPFILAGHSQGSIMIAELLSDYMKANPEVYKRMIAAYAIGAPIDKDYYAKNPHVKPAKSSKDLGVVICYNTEAPVVDGINPLAVPNDAVIINPLSWKTTQDYAAKEENLGSGFVEDGKIKKYEHIADARIDYKRGVIICSTVNREKLSYPKDFMSPFPLNAFPLGVLHIDDIPLYYYNLRQNAQHRVEEYFKTLKR